MESKEKYLAGLKNEMDRRQSIKDRRELVQQAKQDMERQTAGKILAIKRVHGSNGVKQLFRVIAAPTPCFNRIVSGIAEIVEYVQSIGYSGYRILDKNGKGKLVTLQSK